MEMRPVEVDAVIRFARVGLSALSERVLTYLGFVACAALFGYALYEPSWIRAATVSAFAVLVYWPALKLESKRTREE